jgi:nucleotide-binding universal stress UspA family protein
MTTERIVAADGRSRTRRCCYEPKMVEAMTARDDMFASVIVGVDGRSGGRDAIVLAKQLAAARARLLLANVYGHGGMFDRDVLAATGQRDRATALLVQARVEESIEAEFVVRNDRSPSRGLHQLVEHEHADLIVVGSTHRGPVGRVVLGDATLATLNGAPCAVAIAPRGYALEPHSLTTIGVGHDGSEESELALRAARAVAARHGSAIRALSVVGLQSAPNADAEPLHWTEQTERVMSNERARLAGIEGVEGDVIYGDPGEQLVALSESLDLLLVGSRGYGSWGRLINGSTSTYLTRRIGCPLLVLPRGRTSPGAPSQGPGAHAAPAP